MAVAVHYLFLATGSGDNPGDYRAVRSKMSRFPGPGKEARKDAKNKKDVKNFLEDFLNKKYNPQRPARAGPASLLWEIQQIDISNVEPGVSFLTQCISWLKENNGMPIETPNLTF